MSCGNLANHFFKQLHNLSPVVAAHIIPISNNHDLGKTEKKGDSSQILPLFSIFSLWKESNSSLRHTLSTLTVIRIGLDLPNQTRNCYSTLPSSLGNFHWTNPESCGPTTIYFSSNLFFRWFVSYLQLFVLSAVNLILK